MHDATGNWDRPYDIAVSGSGQVYVTGGSSSGDDRDFATVKYSQDWGGVDYTPSLVGYPTFIAPDGQPGCTGDYTTTFTLRLANTADQTINCEVTSSAYWLTPSYWSGTLEAGCDGRVEIEYTIGPIADAGVHYGELFIEVDEGTFEYTVPVEVYVYCDFCAPEGEILSTACWSVSVWNTARAGSGWHVNPVGNMYWWFPIEEAFMFDESVIVTYADDPGQTWFAIFDGSSQSVSPYAQSELVTQSLPTYEYAHGEWSTTDTLVTAQVDYYLPIHPDTCVLIEKLTVCNNADTTIRIHVGEAIDWDIPDGDGGINNDCGANAAEQIVYQFGAIAGSPEADYYGGVQFCNPIPGAIVVDNRTWVYPNHGFDPTELGQLLATHAGFEADCQEDDDYTSVYVIDQYLVLEPDLCEVYCKVKTSTTAGLDDLVDLFHKGRAWVALYDIGCPGCNCAIIGDATGNGAIDIDDVVYLIAYIFQSGPPPKPYPVASGDANCDCVVDIDDVPYLNAYIFSQGPVPCPCIDWVTNCGYVR